RHDQADQVLDVVASFPEVAREAVEQLRMAGRDMVAEVIDRMDKPSTEEVAPQPVDEGPGELVAVLFGWELAEFLPAVDIGPLADLGAVAVGREADADGAVSAIELGVSVGPSVEQLGVVIDLRARGISSGDGSGANP